MNIKPRPCSLSTANSHSSIFLHSDSDYNLSFIPALILDNKMSSELSFLDRLVDELLKSKHNNYSEECINFYIDDDLFSIEDITKISNRHQQRLKCSLIKHKSSFDFPNLGLNSKCVIYLHGYGSNRLQALFLAQKLPSDYCLCIFDMSGSGKSEGERITYGLKQQEDIQPVLHFLHKSKGIKEFVIWGRSMGAVAALLYAINNPHLKYKPRRNNKELSAIQSLKSSVMMSNEASDDGPTILGLVLDSPFCKFREVAKQIAQRKLAIPSFLMDVALNYVEQSFGKILSQSVGEQYNPFSIDLNHHISLSVPVIFLYSEKDQIIASSHSQRIIRNMNSKYSKIPINQCTHNQTRPPSIISEVFDTLASFLKSQQKKYETVGSVQLTRSLQKKRGICIYTPSKEHRREESPSMSLKYYKAVTVELVRTQQPTNQPRNRSHSKRNMVTLQSKRYAKNSKELETISTQNNVAGKVHTLDLQMNRLLNRKLVNQQPESIGLKITRASKRFGHDKRRQVRLSNEKYLK